MGIIAIIPGLFAWYFAVRRSPQSAFLNVYIPVLLLLPEYYRWVLPLLPDPTFSQAAILPIMGVLLLREWKQWRWSITDFLIIGFAFCVGLSEFVNAGYNDAQNLMFDMLTSVVFPYIAAKALIEPKGLRMAFARRFSILLFAVSVVSVFEFRLGMTPWQIVFNRFFPGQGEGWVTTFRYGFARVAGPYGHAILAGLILVIGYRIQRWVEWSRGWEPRFANIPDVGISKARLITLGILAGTVMTLVRGPWLGGMMGALITAVGLSTKRKRALTILASAIVLIGIPAGTAFYRYASVGRAGALTESQETAAYRFELIDRYVDIALQKSALGWGRNGWPKVAGMQSIDNYYLLLALMHGLIADALLAIILISLIVRLVRFEMRRPPPALRGSSLGFTLAGVFVAFAFTITTVYVGLTVMPVFAVLAGWSEGYLLNRRTDRGLQVLAPAAVPAFEFRRVMT